MRPRPAASPAAPAAAPGAPVPFAPRARAAPTADPAPPARATARLLEPPPAADLLLVLPRDGLALADLRDALARAGYAVAPAPALAGAARVAVPPGADPRALAERLARSGLARAVESDDRVTVARLPNDARYAEQADYLAAIRAPAAWDRQTGSPAVVVAVIDTGIDPRHPDLRLRLAWNTVDQGVDGVDDDANGCTDDILGCSFVSLETADPSCGYLLAPPHRLVDDDDGHGSFVAGIAAAAGNDGVGVTGIAWNVRVLPVKVLDCTATGRIADAAAGIRYAARRGADVINISFGSRRDSLVLREAVEAALAAGSVVVASAGNDGADLVTFPAAYPGVIAVAASGRLTASGIDYALSAEFSNFGGRVDLIAPGRRLLSSVPAALCGRRGWFCQEGPYAAATGTSFAAPVVAGAAALVRSEHPGLRPALVRSQLLATAAPPAAQGAPPLLDLAAAVARPFHTAALPGASRGSPAGAPPGPAELPPRAPAPAPPPGPAAPPPAATPPPFPLPAATGHGPPSARPPR